MITDKTYTARANRSWQVANAIKASMLARGNLQSAAAALEAREDYAAAETLRVLQKTAVAPISSGSYALAENSTSDFLDALRPATILGRLGAQQVPFEFRYPIASSGAVAYWTAEGAPIPAGKQAIAANLLAPTKLCVLMVESNEVLNLTGPIADAAFQRSLIGSIAQASDEAFIDPASGAVTGRPASITSGGTSVAGTTNPLNDIENAVELFAGDLRTARWVCNPATSLRLNMHRDSGGNFPFPNAGANGGDLFGIPLLTSKAVPLASAGSGPLILVDGSAIQFADGGMGVESSGLTAIAMSDSPTSPSAMVSMFQSDSTAIRCVRFLNWQVVRTGCVVYISNPNW